MYSIHDDVQKIPPIKVTKIKMYQVGLLTLSKHLNICVYCKTGKLVEE